MGKQVSLPKARRGALRAMQKMRRIEEALEGTGFCTCISCGAIHHYKEMDGGHYIPRMIRRTELEPDNIWPQCKRCNGFLEGNTTAYGINLREHIGNDRVDRLVALRMACSGSDGYYEKLSDDDKRSLLQKHTVNYYLAQKKFYDKRIKEMLKEKGL